MTFLSEVEQAVGKPIESAPPTDAATAAAEDVGSFVGDKRRLSDEQRLLILKRQLADPHRDPTFESELTGEISRLETRLERTQDTIGAASQQAQQPQQRRNLALTSPFLAEVDAQASEVAAPPEAKGFLDQVLEQAGEALRPQAPEARAAQEKRIREAGREGVKWYERTPPKAPTAAAQARAASDMPGAFDPAERAMRVAADKANDVAAKDYWRNVAGYVKTLPPMLRQVIGGLMQFVGEMAPPEGGMDVELTGQFPPRTLDQRAAKFLREAGADFSESGKALQEEAMKGLKPQAGAELTGTVMQSLAVMGPSLLTGIVAGGTTGVLSSMGVIQFGQSYAQADQEKLSVPQKIAYASIYAATEVLTELLPVKALMAKYPTWAARYWNFVVREVPGELIATGVEDALDKVSVQPEMTPEQFGHDMLMTLLSTPIAAGAQAGAVHVLGGRQGLTPEQADRIQKKYEQEVGSILKGMEEDAAAEKRRTEASGTMTHQLADGTPVKPHVEDGKPVPGLWETASGDLVEAGRAEPNTIEPNATWKTGGTEYKVEVTGKGQSDGTARLADGQEIAINALQLDEEAKVRLGLAEPAKPAATKGGGTESPPPRGPAAPAEAAGPAQGTLGAKTYQPIETRFDTTGRTPGWEQPKQPSEKLEQYKDRLRQRAEERRRVDVNADSLIPTIIKIGGISKELRLDLTGEKGGKIPASERVPFVGPLWRNPSKFAGYELDGIGQRLVEEGFLTPAQADDTQLLTKMIQDELAGRQKYWSMRRDEKLGMDELDARIERDRAIADSMEGLEEGLVDDPGAWVTPEDIARDGLEPTGERLAIVDLLARLPEQEQERIAVAYADSTETETLAAIKAAIQEVERGAETVSRGAEAVQPGTTAAAEGAAGARPAAAEQPPAGAERAGEGAPGGAVRQEAGPEVKGKAALAPEAQWNEYLDFYSAEIPGKRPGEHYRAMIWKPSEEGRAKGKEYRVVVAGSSTQLRNQGIAQNLEEAKAIALEGSSKRPVVAPNQKMGRRSAPGKFALKTRYHITAEQEAQQWLDRLRKRHGENWLAKAEQAVNEFADTIADRPKPNAQEPGYSPKVWEMRRSQELETAMRYAIGQQRRREGIPKLAAAEQPKGEYPGKEFDKAGAAERVAAKRAERLAAAEAAKLPPGVGPEEKAAAIRDRDSAILTPPPGSAPPREAKVQPTQQAGLFAPSELPPAEKKPQLKAKGAPGQLDLFSSIDEAAAQTAKKPSEAQQQAGNYVKGHFGIGGMDIAVETAAGEKRRPEWPALKDHYGYVLDTIGKDKDHLDVFVKPGTTDAWAGRLYVVNQTVAGRFDEHKVMLGYDSLDDAREGYLRNYEKGWDGLDSIIQMSVDAFKSWAYDHGADGPKGGKLKLAEARRREISAAGGTAAPQGRAAAARDILAVATLPRIEGRYASAEEVTAELASNPIARAMGNHISTVWSPLDLPPHVLREAIETGVRLREIRAYWDPVGNGRIWLVAGAIPKGEAGVVLLHEAVGHYGVAQVLGENGGREYNAALQEIYDARRPEIAREARSGFLTAYNLDLRNAEHQRIAASEYIAHMAETGAEPTLWQKFVATVKRLLRAIGMTRNWTDGDILHLLQLSRSSLMNGGGATYNGMAAYDQFGSSVSTGLSQPQASLQAFYVPEHITGILNQNGLLGFDTRQEAAQAILDHDDWARRWEVTGVRFLFDTQAKARQFVEELGLKLGSDYWHVSVAEHQVILDSAAVKRLIELWRGGVKALDRLTLPPGRFALDTEQAGPRYVALARRVAALELKVDRAYARGQANAEDLDAQLAELREQLTSLATDITEGEAQDFDYSTFAEHAANLYHNYLAGQITREQLNDGLSEAQKQFTGGIANYTPATDEQLFAAAKDAYQAYMDRIQMRRGKFSVGGPRGLNEIYGIKDGKTLGVARRSYAGQGIWQVYLANGTNESMFATGQFRRMQAGSINEVRRIFNREGLEFRAVKPRNVPAPDSSIFDQNWVAPKLNAELRVPSTWLRYTIRYFQNRLLLPELYERTIAREVGPIPEAAKAHREARLAHQRSAGLIADFDHDHTEPIIEVMKKNRFSLKDVGLYLYAKVAPEVNAYVRTINPENTAGSGMSDERAAQLREAFSAFDKSAQLEQIATMVRRIVYEREQVMIDKGLLPQETVLGLRERYPNYVPLKDMVDDEYIQSEIGSGYRVGRQVSMRFGRFTEAQAEYILPAVIAQAKGTIAAGENAEVLRAFLRLVEFAPNPVAFAIERGVFKQTIDKDTGLTTWVPRPSQMVDRTHLIPVPVNGDIVLIRVADEDLAKAFNTSGIPVPEVLRLLATVTRFYSVMATSAYPEFPPINFLRDVQQAGIRLSGEQSLELAARMGRDAPAAFWGAFSGLRARGQYRPGPLRLGPANLLLAVPGRSAKVGAEKWHAWYRRYIEAGAHIAYRGMQDVETQHKEFLIKLAEAGIFPEAAGALTKGRLRSHRVGRKMGAKQLSQLVIDLNGAIENSIRLATFKNAIEMGFNDKDAAFMARNVSVDFNLKGEAGTLIGSLYMFFNANIQDVALLFRSLINHPKIRAGVVALFFLGMLLDWWNRQRAEKTKDGRNYYDNIGRSIKQRNWVIMGPDHQNAILIPLPFGFGMFPIMGGNLMASLPRDKGGAGKPALEAAGDTFVAVINALSPFGNVPESWLGALQIVSPTPTDPAVQAMTNRDFSDKPIVPERPKQAPPQAKASTYFSGTPEAYVNIAQYLNSATGGNEVRSGLVDISPNMIQHWVRSIFGSTGAFWARVAEGTAQKLSGKEIETRNLPFVRRFYYEPKDYELSRRFYENVNQAEVAQVEVQNRVRAGDAAGAATLRQEFQDERKLFGEAMDAERQVALHRQNIATIKRNPRMSDEQKKLLIEKEESQSRETMMRFNLHFDQTVR